MHPRNPYRVPPDFKALAEIYTPLKSYLTLAPNSAVTVDFRDEVALRHLTEAIMLKDYGIKLKIPEDRLCPPIPNRMNYALWIQDIVHETHKVHSEDNPKGVRGIDIGTGATVVYPLLVTALEKTWSMIGTEIDDASFNYAVSNVQDNELEARITVARASKEDEILFPLRDVQEDSSFYFTMCNPPFYSSEHEIQMLAQRKHLPPSAVCTGSPTEMIYPGGEVVFVEKMVIESLTFRRRCRWYTSMLGRMSSVETLINLLRSHQITNYAITEFVQGRTRRWAIAWSFFLDRLPDPIARIHTGPNHPLATFMPPRNNIILPLPRSSIDNIEKLLKGALESIAGAVLTSRSTPSSPSMRLFILHAVRNNWSRSARRQQKRGQNLLEDLPSEAYWTSRVGMVCSVGVQPVTVPSSTKLRTETDGAWLEHAEGLDRSSEMQVDDIELVVDDTESIRSSDTNSLIFQWLSGEDRTMYESFASHIGRKLDNALKG